MLGCIRRGDTAWSHMLHPPPFSSIENLGCFHAWKSCPFARWCQPSTCIFSPIPSYPNLAGDSFERSPQPVTPSPSSYHPTGASASHTSVTHEASYSLKYGTGGARVAFVASEPITGVLDKAKSWRVYYRLHSVHLCSFLQFINPKPYGERSCENFHCGVCKVALPLVKLLCLTAFPTRRPLVPVRSIRHRLGCCAAQHRTGRDPREGRLHQHPARPARRRSRDAVSGVAERAP